MYRSILERARMKRQLILCALLLTISTGAFPMIKKVGGRGEALASGAETGDSSAACKKNMEKEKEKPVEQNLFSLTYKKVVDWGNSAWSYVKKPDTYNSALSYAEESVLYKLVHPYLVIVKNFYELDTSGSDEE